MDIITSISENVQFWHWLILGVVLLGLEIVVPGTFFLWMGVAAGVVGLILLVFPDFAWQSQIVAFAVLSVIAVVVWNYWLRRRPATEGQPTLNARGAQYVGRVATLSEPLVDGVGKARIDDSVWRVASEMQADLPAGSRVRITGVAGATLVVEKMPAPSE